MRDPLRDKDRRDPQVVSEKMALGAIIATCRDRARRLDLLVLARLLDLAAMAVDEDLARLERADHETVSCATH